MHWPDACCADVKVDDAEMIRKLHIGTLTPATVRLCLERKTPLTQVVDLWRCLKSKVTSAVIIYV